MRVRVPYAISFVYIQQISLCSELTLPIDVMMISYSTTFCFFLFLFSCSSLASPELNLREVCYEDDIFLSFEYWLDDSVRYCSSILSISDLTTFVASTKSYT